jgi:hypothetical protein
MGIPSDPRSTLTNEEWRINTQLRLGLPLASTTTNRMQLCPHGCRHPLSKKLVNVRYGYHLHHVLVTDCLKANQGNKSHKDVEATIIRHSNTHTNITATKPKPFPNKAQADIVLSGVTTIDNPAARNWHLDVTSTNHMSRSFLSRSRSFLSRSRSFLSPGGRPIKAFLSPRRPANVPKRPPFTTSVDQLASSRPLMLSVRVQVSCSRLPHQQYRCGTLEKGTVSRTLGLWTYVFECATCSLRHQRRPTRATRVRVARWSCPSPVP